MQIKRLKYDTNWNIGFCDLSREEFIRSRKLRKIKWLKHPYKDRWFADPFILSYNETEIAVLVEECPIDNPKGIICELIIDRNTMRLKQRYVLLELDTHLSYPAIWRENGKIYVYPENGASGSLKIYEYDSENHRLVNPRVILNEAVADATIWKEDVNYFLVATKFSKTQEDAFLYKSKSVFGPFTPVEESPFATGRAYSRQAGNLFKVEDCLYRPTQNCVARYGSGVTLMKGRLSGNHIQEDVVLKIAPNNWKYSLGLHTLNFKNDLCVIDGSGYLYPYSGVVIEFLRKIKRALSH